MAPPSLLLEELTWPEAERALGDGYRTVVVAVGATEQHGPALPLSVDAERGTRLALEIAERLGRALVAPTIRVGCSEHHMGFAGTLTLRESTLEALCTDYATSLARQGFRDLCFVPSHGGNFGPLASMQDRLATAAGAHAESEVRVHVYADLVGFVRLWTETVQRVAGLGERVGGHADIVEASEMLVVRPDLVRADRAEAGRLGALSAELVERLLRDGMRAITENGVLGDPRGMTEAIGRATFVAAAEEIAGLFKEQMAR